MRTWSITTLNLSEATIPSQSEQSEGEAQSAGGTNGEELEKKKLHDELRSLVDKYEEIAKKMEGSSSVEQLLNHADLPYTAEVMVVPFPPKFKVSQIEMYDGSRDPIDHLENFKVHMILHEFPWTNSLSSLPIDVERHGVRLVQSATT